MQSPVSTFAGQAAPAVGVGAATMGAGVLPTVAAEALLGAAQSPEAPLEGAALGGAFGLVPFAGQGARAAYQQGARMADRVTGRLGQAESAMVDANASAFQQGQRLKGMMSPEEAAADGLPLTAGDRAMLTAGDEAGANVARRMRRMEETRRTDPIFGADIETTRQAQKGWLTNKIKSELGESGPETFTPAKIGDILTKQGARFDAFGKTVGQVDAYEVLPRFEKALGDVTGDHLGALTKIYDEASNMLTKGNGEVSGAELMQLRSKLNRIVQAGQGQGNYAKVYDATQMIKGIDDIIGQNVSKEAQAAYDKLRRDYSITKKLMRPGVVNAEGQVNAQSFRNSLLGSKNPAFKSAGTDPVSRAAVTAALLDQRVVGSSGTAERLLANPGRAALRVGGGAALGAAGLGGGANLLN